MSNLKGPGLPSSLPTCLRAPDRATPAPPPPFCPELPGNTHSRTAFVEPTDKHVQYQQQQTVASLAGWLLTNPRLGLPGPRRQERSGRDNLWPPATCSQLYICHTLMTSSPRPPAEPTEESSRASAASSSVSLAVSRDFGALTLFTPSGLPHQAVALLTDCFGIKHICGTQMYHYSIYTACFSSGEIMNICCLEASSVN